MHHILCVSGFSGTGKDEICTAFVKKHKAIHTGLADPAKRHVSETYGFSYDQLFGPSVNRNAGDHRYPKNFLKDLGLNHDSKNGYFLDNPFTKSKLFKLEGNSVYFENQKIDSEYFPYHGMRIYRVKIDKFDKRFFLSPREVLQLYCNKMNEMYENTWVRLGIEIHREIVKNNCMYDRMKGILIDNKFDSNNGIKLTCFSDFRHKHEIEYTKYAKNEFKDFTPIFIRVKRPSVPTPPFNHRSETEQALIPDSEFDVVVNNDGSIEDLHNKADEIVKSFT